VVKSGGGVFRRCRRSAWLTGEPGVAGASQWTAGPRLGRGLVNNFYGSAVTAPTTVDRLDGVTDDFGAFDRELAPDCEVMKRANGSGLNNVETGQIAASGAAIARGHVGTVSGISEFPSTIPHDIKDVRLTSLECAG